MICIHLSPGQFVVFPAQTIPPPLSSLLSMLNGTVSYRKTQKMIYKRLRVSGLNEFDRVSLKTNMVLDTSRIVPQAVSSQTSGKMSIRHPDTAIQTIRFA